MPEPAITMRDGVGRRRSSRSVPTGPGSRGGRSHLPEYWRDWRRRHPEYRQREQTRAIRKRLLARIRAIAETGSDAGYSRRAARLATSVPGPVSPRQVRAA